jgi:hypothetical protein
VSARNNNNPNNRNNNNGFRVCVLHRFINGKPEVCPDYGQASRRKIKLADLLPGHAFWRMPKYEIFLSVLVACGEYPGRIILKLNP